MTAATPVVDWIPEWVVNHELHDHRDLDTFGSRRHALFRLKRQADPIFVKE